MSSFQFQPAEFTYKVKLNIDHPSHQPALDSKTENSYHNQPDSCDNKINTFDRQLNIIPEQPDEIINEPNNKALSTTIVFLNALGVSLIKYQKVIKGFNDMGYTVVSADYPCTGENKPKVKRGIDYGYDDLVNEFVDKLVGYAKKQTPYNKIILFGHSMGGQLATIYATQHDLPMVGVACGSIYYKNWRGLQQLNILKAVTAFKVLTKVYGYLPGYKMGFGIREPKTQMDNWCRIALTDRFDFITKKMDRNKGQGLFINIKGDEFAPLKATNKLAERLSNSEVIRIKLDKDLKGNQHGIWIKRPEAVINVIHNHLTTSKDFLKS